MDSLDLTPEQDELIRQSANNGGYSHFDQLTAEQVALLKSANYPMLPLMSKWDGTRYVESHVYALPMDQNPAAVYLARLTNDLSRRTMRDALDKIARIGGHPDALALDWAQLRYSHAAAIRARLAATYAPATANKMLSALRGVLKEAWRLGQMSAEDYQRAVDLENIKAETLPAGRDLSFGEIKALADVCMADSSPAGVRDAAIIGVLATCGVRRAELAHIAREDFDEESGKIAIRGGKGNKDRTVYAAHGKRAALLDWLGIRGTAAGALFVPINKGGNVQQGGQMTAQAVYKMLLKRGAEAGVKPFSAHDFRRTFVGDLLDRGVDIATVAKLAGHSDVKTTARYDRRPEETKRDAAD
ncbi:MAG: site-specific integrase, partial [Chloroflexota bacterium]